jgi:hypothetical protein
MYLGRIDPTVFPYSQVVYINSAMGPHIIPAGWLLNNATAAPNVQFWEYKTTDAAGAPLDVSQRAAFSRQLTATEAAQWSDPAFVLGGWSPVTLTLAAGAGAIRVHWTAPVEHSPSDRVELFLKDAPTGEPIVSRRLGSGTAGDLTIPGLFAGFYEVRYFQAGHREPYASATLHIPAR